MIRANPKEKVIMSQKHATLKEINPQFENIRHCPQCGLVSLYGMRGSVTSICKNCGFKDPCCGD